MTTDCPTCRRRNDRDDSERDEFHAPAPSVQRLSQAMRNRNRGVLNDVLSDDGVDDGDVDADADADADGDWQSYVSDVSRGGGGGPGSVASVALETQAQAQRKRTIKKLPSRTLSPLASPRRRRHSDEEGDAVSVHSGPAAEDGEEATTATTTEGTGTGTSSSATGTDCKSPLLTTTGATTPDLCNNDPTPTPLPPPSDSLPRHPFKFHLPLHSRNASASLQDNCNMLMPYWPRDSFSQELALLNVGGFTGAEILHEINEEAAAAAEYTRGGHTMTSGSDDHHHAHTHQEVTSIDRFGGTTGWMEPCSNNKKRKSRRSEVDDSSAYLPAAAALDSRRSKGITASSRLQSHGGFPETLCEDEEHEGNHEHEHEHADEDDEVERPDVSSSTFRASRLVDEMDDHTRAYHHHYRSSTPAPSMPVPTRPTTHPPWSSAFRRRLRSDIRLRLSIKRARDVLWKKMKMERESEQEARDEQQQQQSGASTNAGPSTSAPATTQPPPPAAKPQRKATKAEKRAQALRNKSGAAAGGKKLTLADIRARAGVGSTSAAAPTPTRTRTPSPPSTPPHAAPPVSAPPVSAPPSPPPSPPPPAPPPPPTAPTSAFDFSIPSRITQVLSSARTSIRTLLDNPFDQVIRQLNLPRIIDERWPSIGPTLWKSKTPMLWPSADVPIAKYFPGTVARAGTDVKRVTRGDDVVAQRLVFSASKGIKGKSVNVVAPGARMQSSSSPGKSANVTAQRTRTQTNSPVPPAPAPAPRTSPPLAPTPPKMSRRRKANLNNIHHVSNSARWLGSNLTNNTSTTQQQQQHRSTDDDQDTIVVPPLTTLSPSFLPEEYICMFCEYELFYGEPPLFFRACKHRKQRLREKKNGAKKTGKKKKNSGGGGGGGGGVDSLQNNDNPTGQTCSCESCGGHLG